MKKKTKLMIIVSVIAIVVVAFVGIMIYRNNYYKTHWDTRKHVSDELRDYQTYWICPGRLLKSKEGFYIVGDNDEWKSDRLMYWDGRSKEYDIVCKVPNCKHSSEKCCARFNDDARNFQYSNGYIFYSDWNEEGDEWLYRCKTDGTNRVPMLQVADHNIYTYVSDIKVHDNHVLVAKKLEYDDRTEHSIIDYDMTDKEVKEYEVIKYEGNGRIIIHDIVGSKVLYGISFSDNDEYGNDKNTDICEYNLETKKNVCIKKVEYFAGDINYVDGGIAYVNQNNAVLYKDGKEILLNVDADVMLGCDGKYIYVDNTPAVIQDDVENAENHTIKVYDSNGKLLYTLDMPYNSKKKMRVCYYGDGEKLFVTNFTDKEIYVMELSDFEKGKWTVVNLRE